MRHDIKLFQKAHYQRGDERLQIAVLRAVLTLKGYSCQRVRQEHLNVFKRLQLI